MSNAFLDSISDKLFDKDPVKLSDLSDFLEGPEGFDHGDFLKNVCTLDQYEKDLGDIGCNSKILASYLVAYRAFQLLMDDLGTSTYVPRKNYFTVYVLGEDIKLGSSHLSFSKNLETSYFFIKNFDYNELDSLLKNFLSFNIEHVISILNFLTADISSNRSGPIGLLISSIEILDGKRLETIVRMHLAYQGVCYSDIAYFDPKHIPSYVKSITANLGYEQFKDVYDKLSVLNSYQTLFEYYLNLYHVVEYLMFRLYLKSKFDKYQAATPKLNLSLIQNFKNKEAENELLLDLVKKCTSDTGFKSECEKLFQDYLKVFFNSNKNDFKKFLLQTYRETNGLNQQDRIDVNQFLPNYIYKTRNMIVHNKESESNISYLSLNQQTEDFLRHFLIPAMRLIVYQSINATAKDFEYPVPHIDLF